MEIRNYLRSARGPQDADRAYSIMAGECERGLTSAGLAFAFLPWKELLPRAQTDSAAVAAVKGYADDLGSGRPLVPSDPEDPAATAIAMAYGYCVRALDLGETVAGLAAGWCWLQLQQRQGTS